MTVDEFLELLRTASRQLHAAHRHQMASGDLIPTRNEINVEDVAAFGEGLRAGHVVLHPGGRFDTRDRPTGAGRWGLLSRSEAGGWFNAEYLPQIAAYVRAIEQLGFPYQRVLFELPSSALQLDLAILDDHGQVVVLGEAKRSAAMLDKLLDDVRSRFSRAAPGPDTKRRGDEARQLAWRMWSIRPARLWLIAPGVLRSFVCTFEPLRLQEEREAPTASVLGLERRPDAMLVPPRLDALGG